MNITRENTGDLTATVRVSINQQDYEEKVNKVLKDYQHKANVPGFRPGKVPVGMIRKMYGRAVVADEVNKILSDSITQYIETEKLDILGNPIANPEKNIPFDFETQKDYDFYFDIGLAPKFEFSLENISSTERYKILIDDEMVDRYINDTRKRFGTESHPEEAGADDRLEGELTETGGARGKKVEDGIQKKAFIMIPALQKEESKKALTGLKKGSKIKIKPAEFFTDHTEAAKILGLKEEELTKEGIAFEYSLEEIHRVDPAELNKEFFDKVYPGKEITTEEDFRQKVREEASASFEPETDKLFFRQVNDKILHETPIALPDEFLKRWLLDHKENRLTAEQVEKEYGSFSDSMRWQLIENRLFRENDIHVGDQDIRGYIKNYFLRQIPLNMEDPEAEKRMDSLVDTVMKNTEQVRKINDELYTNRLLELFKSKLTIEEKEISFEEFAKLASAIETHEHHHEHHDHDESDDHDHHHNH
jgi:trigger factor